MVRIRTIPALLSTSLSLSLSMAVMALMCLTSEAFLSAGRTEFRALGGIASGSRPKSLLHGNSNSNSNSNSSNDPPSTHPDTEDNVVLLPLFEAELAKLRGTVAADNNNNNDDSDSDSETVERRIRELEETIDNARTAAEFGVRRIQSEFYDAFSSCDFDTMSTVWSDSDDVCCVHPGMESLMGRSSVMRSWEQIFAGQSAAVVGDSDNDSDEENDSNPFQITPSRVRIDICGRTAICTCVEETNGGRLEALNIYRREGGAWKMVNHMATPTIMRL